jgi:DNA-directed RNA polymerase subunit RPC12/RpoP
MGKDWKYYRCVKCGNVMRSRAAGKEISCTCGARRFSKLSKEEYDRLKGELLRGRRLIGYYGVLKLIAGKEER